MAVRPRKAPAGRARPGPAADVTVKPFVTTPAARSFFEAVIKHGFDPVNPTLPDRLRATRPRDLVDVSFRFENLAVVHQGGRLVLRRKDGGRRARLFLVLPPQHIAEAAYAAPSEPGDVSKADSNARPSKPPPDAHERDDLPLEGVPVPTLMAGPSQLVFDVGDNEIDFTLSGLLEAARRLPLVVGVNVPMPKEPPSLALPAGELMSDPARLRRVATELGTGPARDVGLRRTRRGSGPIEAVAQLRSSAMTLEHRFGREAAVAWVAGQLTDGVQPGLFEEGPPARFPKRSPVPANPFTTQVSGIELPFRLLLSPHAGAAFELRSSAPAGSGPTELWHARLGLRSRSTTAPVNEAPSSRRTVRAVWARDRDVRDLPAGTLPDALEQHGNLPGSPPLRLALNSNDRLSIVHQSSDFSLKAGTKPWTPSAIPVDRLFLSTLGGWLDGGVSWATQPNGFELEEWRNLATLGRDHYVRIVRAGFLFPTGHRASFVKVTERKFHEGEPGNPAFLRQRFFLVVREPFRIIPTLGSKEEDRRNPFHDIRITTVVTPPLDPPTKHPVVAAHNSSVTCFQPMLDGKPFAFQGLVTDAAGNLVELSLPLLFVGKSANDHKDFIDKLVDAYDGLDDDGKNDDTKTLAGSAAGQRLAFAPSEKSGDTELAVDVVRLAARRRSVTWDQRSPKFGPVMASAEVAIPAVDQLTGRNGSVEVTWPTPYLKNGLESKGPNAGQVFLELVGSKHLTFAGNSERSGALLTPDISIKCLSRVAGPVGVAAADFAQGDLDPAALFGGLGGAKLFGVVPLAELIALVPGPAGALGQAPKFLTEALTKAAGLLRDAEELSAVLADPGLLTKAPALGVVKSGAEGIVTQLNAALKAPSEADVTAITTAITQVLSKPDQLITQLEAVDFGVRRRILGPLDRIRAVGGVVDELVGDVVEWVQGISSLASVRTRMTWHPEVKNWNGIVLFADRNRAVTLAVELANPPGATEPLVDVSCSVEGVTIDLHFVKLMVDLIRFSVRGGEKPDIEVQLGDPGVVFDGPLKFVETLKSLIPLDGFSDPPSVDVSPSGLSAGFSLALPNLAVGIFSLENLSLNASLEVPFVGDSLSFRFSFCTRENPFHLIVSLFGGGGYVGIELTPKGIRTIEAALEFGAAVSLDFGVASGSLSVMAGIYFRFEEGEEGDGGGDKLLVSGYFRARGEVDVLGLISASIELTISLTWQDPNKVVGRATLTIEVEVLFFSGSVAISCEKRFSGSGKDPTFREVMGPSGRSDPWREYCQAFVGV